MANQWFKLYGIEMMADPKYQRLTASERSCWITLLCLASMNDGIIKHCEEHYLMSHSGIDPASSEWKNTQGIIVKFEMLGMIKRGRDNAGLEFLVITNWSKRQEFVPMTNYERVKKYRQKHKLLSLENNNRDKLSSNDNEMITDDNSKNRTEQTRIDKIRKEKKKENKFSPPSLNEVKTYCEERKNDIDAEQFINFYESKGWFVGKNKMKDWRAAVRTWENRNNKKVGNEDVFVPEYAKFNNK